MQEWLGQGWHYVNTGGYANVTVDNPFGTSLLAGDVLVENAGPGNAGVAVYGDVLIVAEWEQGFAYAYSHEFGVVPEPPAPPPEIPQGNLTLPPSMVLFGGGAKWAAGNGMNALYVDWYSNWIVHHATDGTWWGPWPAALDMKNWTESIAYVLNESGLNVQFAADIPENLTGYDVVIIHAYWAVEPRHAQLIQDFIANGGGVVVMSGVPEYFRSYCKDWWTYLCPTENESLGMEDWFGTGYYVNTGGSANVTVDNPFNTSLLSGDVLMSGCGGSNAAIVDGDVQVVATWEEGYAFAFAREYGLGRLYYQAAFESLDPPDTPGPVGDVTGVTQGLSDGRVDVRDVTYLILLFQATPSSPYWNPKADLNGDRIINTREVTTAILHFYEHN
jgi:hypothetical protein